MNEYRASASTEANNCNLVYILQLASLAVGVTALIALVMAYINRDDAPDWLHSHYQFQIRTFWLGLLFALIGSLLLTVFVGIFILLYLYLWMIVRCVKGMKYISREQAHPNPGALGM
jgi:uncharacterized membrane protein